MHRVIRSGELPPNAAGSVKFEGEPYGSGVSFFLIDSAPGIGPDLHMHPYSETWIVRRGRARFTADGVEIEAGPGDILVTGRGTPHFYKNIGTECLEMVCIHASPRMIQVELEAGTRDKPETDRTNLIPAQSGSRSAGWGRARPSPSAGE